MIRLHLTVTFFLVGAACSGLTPPPPPIACGASSCTGCCLANGSCVMGDDANACGAGGAACLTCAPDRLCINQACQVEPLPAGAKIVFVTRTTFKGGLGGLQGADALCNSAAAAGLLPGRFKAWLSTNEWSRNNAAVYVHAIDRFTSNGPWYLPGVNAAGQREMIFTSRTAMRAAPLVPISKNELGRSVDRDLLVFTGTEATGLSRSIRQFQSPQETCANWTVSTNLESALLGTVREVKGGWTSAGSYSCSTDASLYCFED